MGRHPLNYELQCKKLLQEAMKLTKGNRTEAAKIMGLSDNTVRNWIKKYDLFHEFKDMYGREHDYSYMGNERK